MTDLLKHDLRKRTEERARHLIEDTFALYHMAKLDKRDAAQSLVDVFMIAVTALLACSDVDPEEVGKYIAKHIKQGREKMMALGESWDHEW